MRQYLLQATTYLGLVFMLHNEKDVIFDRFGEAKVRLLKSDLFVSFQGDTLGSLSDEAVYDLAEKHVGWYREGILRDLSGLCVGFGELLQISSSENTPILPFKQKIPPRTPASQPVLPKVNGQQTSHRYPEESSRWSHKDPVSLFGGRQNGI